jgi:hypothetical protein
MDMCGPELNTCALFQYINTKSAVEEMVVTSFYMSDAVVRVAVEIGW